MKLHGFWLIVAAAIAVFAAASVASSQAPADESLVILQAADPGTLDPHFGVSPVIKNVIGNVLEPLADFDEEGNLVGVLVDDWEVLEDGLTWRFHVKEGLTFQNGEPVNAEAVKFSTDRMQDPELGSSNDIPTRIGLDRVEVVDEYTVDVITEEPTGMVEAVLYRWYVLPPEYYSSISVAEASRAPVGTGPYRLEEYVRDDRAVLRAWDGYRDGPPSIETVVVRVVPELSTRLAELETGGAHIITDLDPDQIDAVDRDPNARVESIDSLRRVFISINTSAPPLDDARVRRALNYAVNWEVINEGLLQGLGERMVLPVNGEYWKHPTLEPYTYDPERARELLAEAGYPDGIDRPLELNLQEGLFVKSLEISQAVAANLADVGIDVSVQPMESSVFRSMVTERRVNDLFFVALASQLHGPKDIQSFAPGSSWNATGWPESSAQADRYFEVFDQMTSTFDRAQKREHLWELQEMMYEDSPAIFLWNQVALYGVSSAVNWQPTPLWGTTHLDQFEWTSQD